MVSARKLFKVLHCKRTYQRRDSSSDDEPLARSATNRRKTLKSGKAIKKEVSVKTERKGGGGHTCRICLREGDIPIYGNDRCKDVSHHLILFTAISLRKNDGHPQHLCDNCNFLLQNAVKLRTSAQYSQHILQKRLKVKATHTNADDHEADYHDPDYHDADDRDVDDRDADDTPRHRNPAPKRPQGKKLFCRRCQVHFENEEAFHQHRLSDEHEKVKKNCPICGKVYDITYLKAHLKYHSTKIVNICDVCGKEFRIKGHFIQHRKIHVHELPFKCRWCPYRCRFNYALKVHMRTHTGEKPYICEHCPDKSFINKSNLNRHLLTHKTGHDFLCDMCQRGFYNKVDLENHFKADHMGIKEHICDICDKAFGLRSQMMKHKLKVHRREKLRSGRIPLYLRAEYQLENGEMAPHQPPMVPHQPPMALDQQPMTLNHQPMALIQQPMAHHQQPMNEQLHG